MSLKQEYFCITCSKTQPIESSTLKTCSRCSLVKYCDSKCQKLNFKGHKSFCKLVKERDDKVEFILNNLPDFPANSSFHNSGKAMMSAQPLADLGKIYFAMAENLDTKMCRYLAYEKAQKAFQRIVDSNTTTNIFQDEYLLFINLNLGKYEEVQSVLDRRESRTWPPNLHLKIFEKDYKGPVKYGSAFYLSRFALWLKKYSK